MGRSDTRETSVTDDLDRQIIRALQVDPRAGFSVIGEVLGVSEQTVARRFRRMRADGLLRVIGMVDPRHLGQSEWIVRVTCRPGGTRPLADALARRDAGSWGTPGAGGAAGGAAAARPGDGPAVGGPSPGGLSLAGRAGDAPG